MRYIPINRWQAFFLQGVKIFVFPMHEAGSHTQCFYECLENYLPGWVDFCSLGPLQQRGKRGKVLHSCNLDLKFLHE